MARHLYKRKSKDSISFYKKNSVALSTATKNKVKYRELCDNSVLVLYRVIGLTIHGCQPVTYNKTKKQTRLCQVPARNTDENGEK